MTPPLVREAASFRDPAASVFYADGRVFRGLRPAGAADWAALAQAPFFQRFVDDGRIVGTEVVDASALPMASDVDTFDVVLEHERIPFVSYPYEWTFEMLRDAARLHLEVLLAALDDGIAMKDGYAYNVQWRGAQPTFIDIGSFEPVRGDAVWPGYRQFCQTMLFPLLLEAHLGVSFQPYLAGSLEGLTPGDMRRMLRGRVRFKRGVFRNVYLHSVIEGRATKTGTEDVKQELGRAGLGVELAKATTRKLLKLVGGLDTPHHDSNWSAYRETCSYSDADRAVKERFVREVASEGKPDVAWDLGCNDGAFARIVAEHASTVVAADSDPVVVDHLYRSLRSDGPSNVLPLVINLLDPSPARGWRGRERRAFDDRGRPDLVLALALVHHLALAGNVPITEVVDWLASLSDSVVVEFVDRHDPMAERLLANKPPGTHDDYERARFEAALGAKFEVTRREELPSGSRVLYAVKARGLTQASTAAPSTSVWRSELRYFLELLALTGLAIAQPVLDVFGRSPETFVLDGADAGTIVAFCVIVCLAPPIALLLGASLSNLLGRGVRRGVQVVILSALFGLFVLQVIEKSLDVHGVALVIASVLLAAGFGTVYARAAGVRLWVRYLAPAPLLFAVLFLTTSQVAPLLDDSSAAGVAEVHVGSPHPIVVLTLDEFPLESIMRSDGTIDAELYPGFARLAASSTWYRNATSVALRTFYAVPAILTGRYSGTQQHLPVLSSYPENLFTLLGGEYDVHASQTITRLCPDDLCKGDARARGNAESRLLDQASSVYRSMISPKAPHAEVSEAVEEATETIKKSHGTQTERPARYDEFLAGLKPSKRPTLDFLHILMPHGPHRYYPSGALYGIGDAPIGRGGGKGDRWTEDAGLVALARQRHLIQVQYTDRLIGQLIDRLQAQGIWDDAVVVVSPDHGIAYNPGETSRNGYGDFVTPSTPDLLWIPMFIKAPGQHAGAISDADVRTIDVLPTIADLVDVEIPWHVDGVSAVGDNPRHDAKKRYFGSWADHGIELPGTAHEIDPVAGNAWIRDHAVDHFRGPGDARRALYRWGPHPDLVGQSLTDVRVGGEPAGRAELGEPGRYAHAAPSKGRVPGIVYGTIEAAGSEPIAVAVNGTIGAVVPRLTGDDGFAALPPDWLWRDGRNDIRLFLVRADGTLRPLTVSDG